MELMHFVWLKVGMAQYLQSLCYNLMLMYRLPFLKAFFSSAHNTLATALLLPSPIYCEVHIAYSFSLVSYKDHILVLTIQFVDPFVRCSLYDNFDMYIALQHVRIHALVACIMPPCCTHILPLVWKFSNAHYHQSNCKTITYNLKLWW
jgi:hypothetical protein